jgi:hypothetical protein
MRRGFFPGSIKPDKSGKPGISNLSQADYFFPPFVSVDVLSGQKHKEGPFSHLGKTN